MGNLTQKQPISTNAKKQRHVAIWSVVGVFLLILSGIVGFNVYSNIQAANEAKKVYPLGDSSKLEYVGEVGYGCWIICDSNPNAIYYYATDMNVEEVIKYFSQATVTQEPSQVEDKIYFGIKTPNSETIYTNYYLNKARVYRDYPNLKKTNKAYILEIPSFKYSAAKNSL